MVIGVLEGDTCKTCHSTLPPLRTDEPKDDYRQRINKRDERLVLITAFLSRVVILVLQVNTRGKLTSAEYTQLV